MINIFKNLKKKNKDITTISKGNISYSQCGEDLIIQYIFKLRNIEKPTYLDIGANHPFSLNNTAIFYLKGSKGINIEANPNLIDSFFKNRPQDINLNIGIGNKEEASDFYIMNDATLSSFSKEECSNYIKTGKYHLVETKKIQLTTIQKVLDKYNNGFFPDFLSLDVEGLDFEVLKTIDFNKSTPKIICVEAAEYSPIGAGKRRNELIDFLINKNYFEYANTNLNAIMVRKDFWFI